MNLPAITIFTLLMTLGWMGFLKRFEASMTNPNRHNDLIEDLRLQVKEAKLETELREQQLLVFEQEVAQVLPQFLKPTDKTEKTYQLRGLASVVQTSPQGKDLILGQKANLAFNKGKEFFQRSDYQSASREFGVFVRDFSFSVRVPEALFLLFESQFQLNNWEQALATSEKMMAVFPESDLTGFALLRTAKIYELQGRMQDAADMYQTVLRTFPNRGIASQARQSLEDLQ